MKKTHTIIVSCILAAGMLFSGLALAESHRKGTHRGFGFKKHYKGSGLMLLAKFEQKNLAVEVLSELSGQPTEAISAMVKEKRKRTLMQELNIDRQAFRSAMQVKVNERIRQAVQYGTISPEQEKEIYAIMELRSKRRELMSKLIEKGIADGTITPEEAQLLERKRR